MTVLEIRQKIHQQIDQLLPDQLNLISEFLDFLQFKRRAQTTAIERQAGLHLNAFQTSEDFDAPLPDSFWLGEN